MAKQLFEKSMKKLFNAFGLKVTRMNQRTTFAEVLDHIVKLGFRPSVIIDVGVAYGTYELYEKFPNSKFLLIEPIKEWEEVLKEISRKYEAEYVLAAAGDKPGKMTINVHSDLSNTSIFKEVEGKHVDGTPREIPVVTIDDLFSQRNLRDPYLIKIDVQGAELFVLDGAQTVLKGAEMVIIEVSLFQFFRNGPQLFDVVNYMKDRGFVVFDIFGFAYRPLDGALAQVDLAFVKENGQFRKCHDFATFEQRKQLIKRAQQPKS